MKLLWVLLWFAGAGEAAPCIDKQQCTSCESNGRCISTCNEGFYGLKCQHQCSTGCRYNICHLENGIDRCTHGCKPGFYGTRCIIPCEPYLNTCRKCPQECEGGFCQLESSCAQGCQDSFYGNTCMSCPRGCAVCNRVSGTCEDCLHCQGNCSHGCKKGCKPGYFGKFCEHSCSSECLSGCNQTSGYCFDCESGWFGATCKKHCPRKCMDRACDIDGKCTSGCTKGWFGQTCEAQCSKICLAKDCNQTGVCTQGCKDGWYGQHCEVKCTHWCRGEICARNGNCVYGCKVGFYGIKCENQCSASCLNKVCDEKNGTCSSCEKGFYGGHCNEPCDTCLEGSCRDACSIYEGDVTSDYIPYIVAAVVVVIVSALVTYAACRFKRLQSVIYGNRRGKRNHFQSETDPTVVADEPTVNFYSELDEDANRPSQLPRPCGPEDIASPLTLSRDENECISNSQEQRDDTSENREEATPNSQESDSSGLAEHHIDDSVHNDECEDVCGAADLHVPSCTNSYLSAEDEDCNEGMQVDVSTEQVKATRSDTRPPEMVDMRSLTRSQGHFLSVPSVFPQASGFDAGSHHVTTETQNDCDAVTSFHINDRGFDEVPSLHGKPQGEGFTGSDGYARAKELSTTDSHNTAESPEDDNELTTISVPVIADCYDNFPVDGEEEAIPHPPPDNYSKLFTSNYVRK